MGNQSPLISVDELAQQIGDPALGIIDATWIAPFLNTGKTGFDHFAAGHIPNAIFFDIDEVADLDSPFSHTVPSKEQFSNGLSRLGLTRFKRFVVYDQNGFFASARVWWLFRLFGLDDITVLNGGFAAWIAAGNDVSKTVSATAPSGPIDLNFHSSLLSLKRDMLSSLCDEETSIYDARPIGRFSGTQPEPREGLASGHIPGSINLPHSVLIAADGRLKDRSELERIFEAAGGLNSNRLVASCGSGVSAAVIALAAATIGKWSMAVYDGSWTEWANDPQLPIATSET